MVISCIGRKFPSDSILKNLTKEKLIELLKIAEHNYQVQVETSKRQYDLLNIYFENMNFDSFQEMVSKAWYGEVAQVAGDRFDLTLPIFKHWSKVFNNYGYKLINSSYYSSNYSENCISIVPINVEDANQYHYPCLVHGRNIKGFGIKVKHWKNLGNKFECKEPKELTKLLKQFINELNTGNKSKKYIQEKQDELNKIAEELNNLYTEWTE